MIGVFLFALRLHFNGKHSRKKQCNSRYSADHSIWQREAVIFRMWNETKYSASLHRINFILSMWNKTKSSASLHLNIFPPACADPLSRPSRVIHWTIWFWKILGAQQLTYRFLMLFNYVSLSFRDRHTSCIRRSTLTRRMTKILHGRLRACSIRWGSWACMHAHDRACRSVLQHSCHLFGLEGIVRVWLESDSDCAQWQGIGHNTRSLLLNWQFWEHKDKFLFCLPFQNSLYDHTRMWAQNWNLINVAHWLASEDPDRWTLFQEEPKHRPWN